jgi:hypothetical protein
MASLDDYANAFDRDPYKTSKRWFWKGLVLLISLILIGFAIRLILLPAKTATEVIEKTMNADNVLYNYHWFKTQYQDFLALKAKKEVAEKEVDSFKNSLSKDRKDWDMNDKNELSRLQTISSGIAYQLKDVAAKYNAASQMADKSIFKTSDLPKELIVE